MTTARRHLVPPGSEGCYHCVQRCVRRAFLCGEDPYCHRTYDHRKTWIEDRLRLLGECFAVAIHAYAVMSNHLHLVLQMAPSIVATWTDEEAAARWLRIFPTRADEEAAALLRHRQLVSSPQRIALIRTRLCDLSWFMRCLAEPIARRANREDDCKGRFWEGRYKCQLLCDERALLAAMTYVDLNPIRAGTAQQLHTSAHTSVIQRIQALRAMPELAAAPLRPAMGLQQPTLSLSNADYLQLLDWSGRCLAPGKRGRIDIRAPAVIATIDSDPTRWILRVRSYGGGWFRVVGSAQDLRSWADRVGQRWLQGIRLALLLG